MLRSGEIFDIPTASMRIVRIQTVQITADKEDLLNYEINQKFSLRRRFKKSYESARSSLKSVLSPLDFKLTSVLKSCVLSCYFNDESK